MALSRKAWLALTVVATSVSCSQAPAVTPQEQQALEVMLAKEDAVLQEERKVWQAERDALLGKRVRVVSKDGKSALWRGDAKVRDLPNYYMTYKFENGLAAVMDSIETQKWGFIDETGREVVKPRYDHVESFDGQMAVVANDERFGFINRSGKVVIALKFSGASGFLDGLARVSQVGSGQKGFIDRKGKLVIGYRYDRAGGFDYNGLSSFRRGQKWGFIDKTGAEAIAANYDDARSFPGFVWLKQETKWALADTSGKPLTDFRYDEYYYETDETFPVRVGKVWGFIDLTGKEIVKPNYVEIRHFRNGHARVLKDKTWIYIDKAGKMLGVDPSSS